MANFFQLCFRPGYVYELKFFVLKKSFYFSVQRESITALSVYCASEIARSHTCKHSKFRVLIDEDDINDIQCSQNMNTCSCILHSLFCKSVFEVQLVVCLTEVTNFCAEWYIKP